MTEKLYYQDSYLREFTASVTSLVEKEGNYHIALDRTAFYPEGGGQPADRGSIGGGSVVYVYEEEERIYHVLPELPAGLRDSGDRIEVRCELDWERRFDFMQQHTGQHLLSAAADELFGARTVGFHLSETGLTIDADMVLRERDIERMEIWANERIYEEREVRAEFPGVEELKQLDLRKEPQVEENIRVVRISGLDAIPCGGTHLDSTGQIGSIKVVEVEKYKGGSRLHFVCGRRALDDYRFKNRLAAELRDELSVSDGDIGGEVRRMQNELEHREAEITALKEKLREYQIDYLIDNAEELGEYNLIRDEFEGGDFSEIKYMAEEMIEKDDRIVILAQRDEGTARMVLARSENIAEDLNMNEIIAEALQKIDGRGGGHKYLAQGGGDGVEKLPAAAAEAERMIREKL